MCQFIRIRFVLIVQLLLLLATVILLSTPWRTKQDESRPVPAPPTIDQIELLSTLTTLRVEVADACEVTLRGKTGGLSAVVIVRGDATISFDLTKAKFIVVDNQRHHAILQMPEPTVDAALDLVRTHVVTTQAFGLWAIVPDGGIADARLIERSFNRGEELVAAAASDPKLADQAKGQASQVLTRFAAAAGWAVDCQWNVP